MEIIIIGSEETGMPEEMIRNCITLLEWRIKETPEIEEEIDILCSEKDPLQETGEFDDEAYTICFRV